MTTSSTEAHAGQRSPQPPQLHYTCPHCGGPLDLAAFPIALPDASALTGEADPSPASATRPSLAPLSRLSSNLLERWFPVTSALSQQAGVPTVARSRTMRVLPRWSRYMLLLLPLAFALL